MAAPGVLLQRVNNKVNALAIDNSGNLYAGENYYRGWEKRKGYSEMGWQRLSTIGSSNGLNNGVYSLATDTSGNLYAGGYFTTAGGNSVNHIAKWNGSNWSTLGSGMILLSTLLQ